MRGTTLKINQNFWIESSILCAIQRFRQNKALDDMHGDVEELNSRVKQANQRARKILAD